jgi:Flp pilus assembly pilin Flp
VRRGDDACGVTAHEHGLIVVFVVVVLVAVVIVTSITALGSKRQGTFIVIAAALP